MNVLQLIISFLKACIISIYTKVKKNVKKIVKNRSTVLFDDFLDDHERKASDWTAAYLNSPVLKAVANVNSVIAPALVGMTVFEQSAIDEMMCQLDGTSNKSHLGANAILGVSLAAAKAAAASQKMSLYQYIGGVNAKILPVPMMNILNGGAHASNNVDIQEFMIMAVSAGSWKEALQRSTEVFHTLKIILKEQNIPVTGVGDEGGYAPMLKKDEDALSLIVQAIRRAGYIPGQDFMIAIDAASSEWYEAEQGIYRVPKAGKIMTRHQMVRLWKRLAE